MSHNANMNSLAKKVDKQYLQLAASNSDQANKKPYEKDSDDKDSYEKDSDEKDSDDKACYNTIVGDKYVNREIKTALPVSIKPTVTPQKPHVKYLKDVEVHHGTKKCKSPQKIFDYTVTQDISVKIPIGYHVEVCYGEECFEAAD